MLNEWDRNYMKITDLTPEPKPAHWAWSLVGMVLAMVSVSLVIAWLIEGMA